jgi:gluconate kinase
MSNCAVCDVNLLDQHELETTDILPMKNGSRIIAPLCANCRTPINVSDVSENITSSQSVVLISGAVGAGKSTIGQYIEDKYNYVFIDGDAVSKKVNFLAKTGQTIKHDEFVCHTETINMMLVILGLGYNVIVGYVFSFNDIKKYRDSLLQYRINPIFRVLIPSRDVCIERDKERPCWTAGVEFVDRWYNEQESFRDLDENICIDNSTESVKETVMLHFHHLL